MALTKATYAMVSGAPYNVLDYGADPSGVADSTAAINAALTAAVAAGGGEVYIPAGTYLVNGRVDINGSNLRIYGDGTSSVLRKTPTATHLSLFYFTGGTRDNIEIDHLKFVSTVVYAPEYSWAFVDIALGSVDWDNVSIHDNYFTAPNENRACIITAQAPGYYGDRLRIFDNVFDDILGAAIAILNQNSDTEIRNYDIKITGNTFNTVKYFVITISGPAMAVIIANNTFTGTKGACGYGIELVAAIQGVLIEGNIFDSSFTQPMISTSAGQPAAAYGSHQNVTIKGNVTPRTITASIGIQSANNVVFEGNTFYLTEIIFSGVSLGVNAWVLNNRTNVVIQNINGASVLRFNNWIGSIVPYEGGYLKSGDLSGGATTATTIITARGTANWTPTAFRVSVAQVFGDGSGGGFAESIIAFRNVNGSSAVQISKTDTVTSAGVTLTVAYGTNTATVTATSGTANVTQSWKVEPLTDNIVTIA